MAGFSWSCLKPLAMAAALTLVVGTQIYGSAQTSSNGQAAKKLADDSTTPSAVLEPSSAQAAQLRGTSAAAATTATITGTEIESLPANGRQWEQFVMDAPADAAQSNGAPPSLTFSGQQATEVSVDGVGLRSPFGSTSVSRSGSPTQTSSPYGAAEPSGMGQA